MLQQALRAILGLLGWVFQALLVLPALPVPQEPLMAPQASPARPVTWDRPVLRVHPACLVCPALQEQLTAALESPEKLEELEEPVPDKLVKLGLQAQEEEPKESQVRQVGLERLEPLELEE